MIEKVLITVKSYPNVSCKYTELVCTAGVNESGEWRRIFPIQFRQLYEDRQYKKYQWIEVDIGRSMKDRRPESYEMADSHHLKTLGDPLPTENKWRMRNEGIYR